MKTTSFSKSNILPMIGVIASTMTFSDPNTLNEHERNGNQSNSGEYISQFSSSNLQPEHVKSSYWYDPAAAIGYNEAEKRILKLSEKTNDWKGSNSFAPSKDAQNYAYQLLTKLHSERIEKIPSIGLDYEGTFSFFWSDQDITIDLTTYEDGSYSFFATDGSKKFSVDEASLYEPLHQHLLSILLS